MKIQKKRYACTITNKETLEEVDYNLFDEVTAQGTSGEGTAFAEARKIAIAKFGKAKCSIYVYPVILTAEIDIKKAVECGALSEWKF